MYLLSCRAAYGALRSCRSAIRNLLWPAIWLLWGWPGEMSGQGSCLPLGNPAYHAIDRLSVKTGVAAPQHSALKYYGRGDAARFALAVDSLPDSLLSPLDRYDLAYMLADNNEWLGLTGVEHLPLGRRRYDPQAPTLMELALAHPRYPRSRRPLLKHFYRTPANFFEIDEPHFHFRLNPVLHLRYGPTPGEAQPFFLNQRGVEARAGVDDRVYIYFQLLESQAQFPDYVDEWVQTYRALPGNGLYKNYNSDVFNIKGGYDYLNSQGYVAFNLTPHLGVQWGYGRNFIGNGYRSLLLSDFSNNYLYLKLNWQVGRFHYQNLFGELKALSANGLPGDQVLPRKYLAAHHLSIDLTPRMNIGFFEAIVYHRNNQLELSYLNPIILYRSAELGLGSPDNVLIGIDGRWDVFRRVQLYGQLMLDEFVFKELFVERRGWWANKFGIQAGAKYFDVFGVDHLDLQAEFNAVRPYTYTHRDSSSSYSHYSQPLAHPLGANFAELMFRAQYRPAPRWFLDARAFLMVQGEEAPGQNFGANVLLPHTTRVADYGVNWFQGVRSETVLGVLDVGYQLRHNFWIEAQALLREKTSDDGGRNASTRVFNVGIRWNVDRTRMEF